MRRSAVTTMAAVACALVIGSGPVSARQAKVLEPVALQDLLPTAGPAEFVRQTPQGGIDSVPGIGRVSHAEVSFKTKGEVPRTIRVTISDLAEHSMAAMALNAITHPAARETATGYEKGVTVKGKYPGTESVERMRQECGVSFAVGDRFLVEVQGQWVELATLYEAIGKIPLDRLEQVG
jgi:hypothetical protein